MRKRNRTSLDIFNYMPYSKRVYLKNYGYHFNKASYEFACSLMWKETNGKEEGIKPVDKEILKTILKRYNVEVPNDAIYDACYVYSAAMADYMGRSIPNEQYLALHIRDRIHDVDKRDGYIFNQFLADCEFEGVAIDFEEFL